MGFLKNQPIQKHNRYLKNKQNYLKMKLINKILLGMAFAIILGVTGCGDDPLSPKEQLQKDLTSKTWTIDVAASDVSVTGIVDVSTITVTFAKSDAGATFTLGGDISDYLTGGEFDIDNKGVTSNLSLLVGTQLEAISVTGFTADDSNFGFTAVTSIAGGRTEGVGSYVLKFNGN